MIKQQDTQKRGGFRGWAGRALRLTGRLVLTLAIVAGAAFSVQFGASELGRRADAAPAPDAAPVIPVSASPLVELSGYSVERAFIGQIEPQKTASVSFELSGRLQNISVDEGDWVTEGQVLATQDTSLLAAEKMQLEASRTATQAQLKFADQTVQRSEELNKRGFTSQAGLDEALARQDELNARIREIEAGLENVAIRKSKSQIRAPFDGRVTVRLVDGGETLGPGQKVLELVQLRKPQVRVGVPLDLKEDQLATASIDVDGRTLPASLVTLRPDIDAVTRTRTAIFEIDTDEQPAFGQAARLKVTQQVSSPGVWLPTTSLKEGVRGQWTILTVDPESTVRAASVEILHAESERVYVRGAFPDGTLLIDQGPQRVTVGQQVVVTENL